MKSVLFIAVVAALTAGCKVEGFKNVAFLAGREIPAGQRQTYWAQPIQATGVPNMYRVSDDLYRGDEPTRNGMKQLGAMGIRTVVCVRSLHSTQSRVNGLGMKYEQIKMVAWEPTDDHMIQFLRIMKDPANRPVFIHCYTGGDRAGLLTAFYRVIFNGWTKEEARREMLEGGYGFHQILVKYLVTYYDNVSIDELARRAGITQEHILPADIEAAMPLHTIPPRSELAWPNREIPEPPVSQRDSQAPPISVGSKKNPDLKKTD